MKSVVWIGIAVLVFAILAASAVFLVRQELSKRPEISVSTIDYKISDTTKILGVEVPTGVSVLVGLNVYNPSMFPLTLESVSYEVRTDEIRVGGGRIEGPFTLPSESNTSLSTEVKVSALPAVQALVGIIGKGSVEAKVSGSALVRLPLMGSINVPFTVKRNVTVSDL